MGRSINKTKKKNYELVTVSLKRIGNEKHVVITSDGGWQLVLRGNVIKPMIAALKRGERMLRKQVPKQTPAAGPLPFQNEKGEV